MLTLRLLWRNLRSGELQILTAALMLSVMLVTGILVFTSRVEQSLLIQSHSFLAADRIIKSGLPIPDQRFEVAEQFGLAHAMTAEFRSMVFAHDQLHLASVKAVSEHYPLRGVLELSDRPFENDPARIYAATEIPPSGEAWVDSRLIPLLGIRIGDEIELGEASFRVTKVIFREPDRGTQFFLAGARVLINATDLEATQVIQPGSRITYKALFAGSEKALNAFATEIHGSLSEHEQLQDLDLAQARLSKTLTTAKNFLVLAGIIGVLLSGIAMAIATRHFAFRHTEQVALLKSFGLRASRVRQLYFSQLFLLALIASALGMLAGHGVQASIASTIAETIQTPLAPASGSHYLWGALTGIVALLGFAIPALWYLPGVPPVRIFRRDVAISHGSLTRQGWLAILAIAGLMAIYSQNIAMTLTMMAGIVLVGICLALPSRLLISAAHITAKRAGGAWRLAMSGLIRNKSQSSALIMVFASAIMLLMILFVIRTSLLNEWRVQLTPNAPNHFLVNIAPDQVTPIQQLIADHQLESTTFYPMVRGRLTQVNYQPLVERQTELPNGIKREINLSASDQLPAENHILEGRWFDRLSVDSHGVSVEAKLASDLQLNLGDELTFSIGGMFINATITSLRSVNWESLRPNFYFLFEPETLATYTPSYLTSLYIPPSKKHFVNTLISNMPTVSVIEVDTLIERIQTMINQVGQGISLVLWLVLVAGVLVLLSAVHASLQIRLQESALLRALGCHRKRLRGSLWLEFTFLGGVSGLFAAAAAESVLLGLQHWVFHWELQPHPALWLAGPISGALLIGILGAVSCRHVIKTPPAVVLNSLSGL